MKATALQRRSGQRSESAAEYIRWYKLARWRHRRATQLQDEPLCRMCREVGRITPATVADHIRAHRGDAELFWHVALQSLCAPCHDRHAQRRDRGRATPAIGVDGWPRLRLRR